MRTGKTYLYCGTCITYIRNKQVDAQERLRLLNNRRSTRGEDRPLTESQIEKILGPLLSGSNIRVLLRSAHGEEEVTVMMQRLDGEYYFLRENKHITCIPSGPNAKFAITRILNYGVVDDSYSLQLTDLEKVVKRPMTSDDSLDEVECAGPDLCNNALCDKMHTARRDGRVLRNLSASHPVQSILEKYKHVTDDDINNQEEATFFEEEEEEEEEEDDEDEEEEGEEEEEEEEDEKEVFADLIKHFQS